MRPDPAVYVPVCGWLPAYRAAEDLIFITRLQTAGTLIAFAARAEVQWQIAGGLGATFDRFANYSHHNLVAGWGRHWHLGVARLYGLVVLVIVATHLAGGGAWAWLAWPLFFVARATRAAWVKRSSFSFSTLHPARILGAAGILAVIDGAAMAGCVRWLWQKLNESSIDVEPS